MFGRSSRCHRHLAELMAGHRTIKNAIRIWDEMALQYHETGHSEHHDFKRYEMMALAEDVEFRMLMQVPETWGNEIKQAFTA